LLALAVLVPLNFLGIWILRDSPQLGVAPDFQQYAGAWQRLLDGVPLYGPDWKWRYSPVALLLIGPATAAGLAGWTALHFAAVLLIRPWWLAVGFGLSWPFWVDVVSGNTGTFVAVAGIAAISGSRIGVYSYWWLLLVIPRPLQLPLAAYLIWRRPHDRIGFLILATANLALLIVMGQGPEWISYLVSRGAENVDAVFNIHPGAGFGAYWLIVGVPVAALLVRLGWPGQAGLALSPSLLAQYLLMAFVPRAPEPMRRRPSGPAVTPHAPDDDSVGTQASP
jgi:hypothetical protein